MNWRLLSYGLTVHGGGIFLLPLLLSQILPQRSTENSNISLGIPAAFLLFGLALEVVGFFRKEPTSRDHVKGLAIQGFVIAFVFFQAAFWTSLVYYDDIVACGGVPEEYLRGFARCDLIPKRGVLRIIYGVGTISSTIVFLSSLIVMRNIADRRITDSQIVAKV